MPSDYARIEKIIHYLDQHHHEQPSLAELAAQVDLNPTYFQKLFTRWAGVSPKTFLQYLTITHARHWLKQSESLLHTALESGLSGTGRLHDLTLKFYGVTPGELKVGATGLTFRYGFADSPFGRVLLVMAPRGICALRFVTPENEEEVLQALAHEWPGADWVHDPQGIGSMVSQIFQKEVGPLELPLFIKGTSFQLKVWEALLRVPEGLVTTYGQLAAAIGAPKASRAVGTAVGDNPVAYLIPCHRVIRQTGAFSQYRWGAERKKALLGWEAAQTFAET